MRKLIVQQWVTVDNIAAEDAGGLVGNALDSVENETTAPSQVHQCPPQAHRENPT